MRRISPTYESVDNYEACGLSPRIAVGDHQEGQALADDLRAAGFRGLLSLSAALPGAVNLSLFGERYEKLLLHMDPWKWPNPDRNIWLPCQPAVRAGPGSRGAHN